MEIKTNKWHLLKLKNFYTEKETIKKTKRHPIDWEKYLQMMWLQGITLQNLQTAHDA